MVIGCVWSGLTCSCNRYSRYIASIDFRCGPFKLLESHVRQLLARATSWVNTGCTTPMQDPAASNRVGSSNSVCCLPTCSQRKCGEGFELVHALNISHSSLNPTSVWEKHFVAWMYMDVYCLLLSTLRSRYVKIARLNPFFQRAGVCEACPWPGWVPNKLKANDAGASDEECCLKTCKLHTCNATWISFDKLI